MEKKDASETTRGRHESETLVELLKTILKSNTNMLVGCTRRHVWMEGRDIPWYMLKGNAYLRVIATPQRVSTPVGPIGVWWCDSTVVDFRGGPLRDWWYQDIHETWALTQEYSGLGLRPYAYILQENRGELHVHTVQMDTREPVDIGKVIRRGERAPFGRLAKNTQRAYHVCKSCPVKRECDTTDKVTEGGTDDWGVNYPVP